ncbi:uncharacterized protein DS421_19g660050 [Arachis hypogaea]|uniref:Uncharacterized protein n=1 Tax=Arachis hypogaea TaxID=3818 RepID=A0A6B9VC68_ARAHY|nr:uncharacterized protein DS421_19g660050 [Arachis hypogaea]
MSTNAPAHCARAHRWRNSTSWAKYPKVMSISCPTRARHSRVRVLAACARHCNFTIDAQVHCARAPMATSGFPGTKTRELCHIWANLMPELTRLCVVRTRAIREISQARVRARCASARLRHSPTLVQNPETYANFVPLLCQRHNSPRACTPPPRTRPLLTPSPTRQRTVRARAGCAKQFYNFAPCSVSHFSTPFLS